MCKGDVRTYSDQGFSLFPLSLFEKDESISFSFYLQNLPIPSMQQYR